MPPPKHHERHVRLCLSNKPKLARTKKRRNVITAVGHFTSWITEIGLFGLLDVLFMAAKGDHALGFAFVLLVPSINYVVFPVVQILSSENLRGHLTDVDWSCSMRQCLRCPSKSGGHNEDGEAQSNGIELMANGNPSFPP